MGNDPNCLEAAVLASTLEWETTDGEEYFLFVQGFDPSSSGTFVLTLEDVTSRKLLESESSFVVKAAGEDLLVVDSANDVCLDAVDVTEWIDSGFPVLGSTEGSSEDTDRPFCSELDGADGPGVWFKIDGNGRVSKQVAYFNVNTHTSRFSVAITIYLSGAGIFYLSPINFVRLHRSNL